MEGVSVLRPTVGLGETEPKRGFSITVLRALVDDRARVHDGGWP